jgi:hypothetical protein
MRIEGGQGKQLHQDMTSNPPLALTATNHDQLTMPNGLPPTSTAIDHTSQKEDREQHTPPSPVSTMAYHTYNSTPSLPPTPPPPSGQPPAHPHDQHHFKSGTIPPSREKPSMSCIPMPSAMEAAACMCRTAHYPQGGPPCQLAP